MTERPFLPLFQAWRRARVQDATTAARRLPLRSRADAVFLTVAAVVTGSLGLTVYGGMEAARRLGWLDPPVVAPVRDERLLDNLRRDLPEQKLLAAAWHGDEGVLSISQSGGSVHRFDPGTGLWSRETPSKDAPALQSDLVQMRAGCGGDPAARSACADPAPLWGLGERGALVRRHEGTWRTLIGDSAFIGNDGKPVDGESLTAAALSDDGRWLFLGTKAQGGGLYDLKERRWTALGAAQNAMPNGRIERAVWWHGRFAVGGPGGLVLLSPDAEEPNAERPASLDGAVADLLVDADRRLLVLEKRACDTGGDGCLRVSALRRPGAGPEFLMDERNRYPELDAAGLFFADLHGKVLVVAGQKGVFAYDPDARNWTRLDDRPVRTAARERGAILYGYSGGAARVLGGRLDRRWDLPGKQVRQIVGLEREPAALTDDGDVYSLPSAGEPKALFVRGGTTTDPKRFTAAFVTGDRVLLTGPRKALLHDVRQRSYTDIDPGALPPWLTDGQTKTVMVGTQLYGLVPQGNGMAGTAFDLATAASGSGTAAGTTPTVPGPVRQARSWTGGSLAVIDGQGSLRKLGIGKDEPLTGAAQPALDRLRLRDVVDIGGSTVIATETGIRTYDHAKRQWSDWDAVKLDGGDIRGIAANGQNLLLHTGKERLGLPDGRVLIGRERVTLNTGVLSDAWQSATLLHLAGRGGVEQYDLAARSVTRRWNVPGNGPVGIVDLLNGEPLTLSEGRLAVGERPIGANDGRVLSVSSGSGAILTVREQNGGRYLRIHDPQAPLDTGKDRCLFRTANAGGRAQRIVDARALGDGWLLILTDDGLRLYSESARSWYPVRSPSKTPTSLHRLGNHVALVAGQRPAHVQFLAPSEILRPGSCATDAVPLPDRWFEVSSISVDEASGAAAWLAGDGAVLAWKDGNVTPVLASPRAAPPTDQILRVFRMGERLAFGVPDGLALYRIADHSWTRVQLRAANAPLRGLVDLNVEPDGAGQALTARTEDGRSFAGSWDAQAGTVSMQEIQTLRAPPFVQPGSAIVDVVSDGGFWTFLLDDRLKRFDPGQRRFAPDILFPVTDRSRVLAKRGDRLVVEEAGGQAWWVAKGPLPASSGDAVPADAVFDRVVPVPGEPTLVADNGRILRLRNDGAVLACPIGGNCSELAPAALPLDPGTVRAAYEIGNLVLFETGAGRLLYDRIQRRERPLPPELTALGTTSDALREENLLWLRDRNGTVVTLNRDGAARKQATAVDALLLDRDRRIWLKGPSVVFERERLRSVAAIFGLADGVNAQVLTLVPDGIPALVGSDRRPRALNAGPPDVGPPLAPDIDLAAVSAIVTTPRRDVWWVRVPDGLTRLVRGTCPPPQASAAAPPVEAPPQAQIPAGKAAVSADGDACLVADVTLPLTDSAVVTAVDDDLPTRLTVRLADGETLDTRMRDNRLEPAKSRKDRLPAPAAAAPDAWAQWRSLVAPRPDGVPSIAPAVGFEASGASMRIKRAGGDWQDFSLLVRRQPDLVRPLDAGWLKWDRPARRFQIAGTRTTAALTSEQFIRDGQFIFAAPGVAVADVGGTLRVASRFGIWSFPGPALKLDGPNVLFDPQDLPAPVAAAHGRFLFESGGVTYSGGAATPDDDRHTVAIDDAVWTERLRKASVSVDMKIVGRALPAGGNGFAWDRRQAVALADGTLQVQTDAGILRVDRLANADPGWSGQLPVSGTIVGRDGGDLFLSDGGRWLRRSGGTWQPSTLDAVASRDVPTSQPWQWRVTPQGVTVAGVGLAAGSPVSFLDDQLRAAAFDGGRLMVVDASGLAIGSRDAVAGRGARHQAPGIDVDSLQPMRPKPTARDLLARGRDGLHRWDSSGGRFVPVADVDNPFLHRTLIDHPRLRAALRDGRALVELRLDSPSGGGNWVPLALDNGFPFDRVTGIHVQDGRLFVGTDAGLEEHADAGSTGFDSITRLVDLRASGTAPPAPVQRMGEPATRPGVLAVRSPGRCLVFDGRGYADCATPDLADLTRRATTPWWQWLRDAAGTMRGEYRDGTGQGLGLPAVIQGGRFPHDRITDMATCNGRAALLWDSGPVTVQDGGGVDLNRPLRTAALPARDAELYCLERPVREPGLDVPAGLYWIGTPDVRRYDSGVWQPLAGDAAKAAVRMRAGQGMPLDRERLRLVQDRRGGLQFQHRRIGGAWEELAWKDNRIALDVIERLTLVNGQLWAATAGGFATLDRAPDGAFQVDPDRLTILREPAGNCRVTDLETGADGETWVRCNADTRGVHRGRLDPRVDQAVFRPAGTDPFAERDLVPSSASGGIWSWKLTGHSGGRPGQLTGTFRNEPAHLAGGRFGFDSLSQIRTFVPGTLELLTEGVGWFRAGGGGISLQATARPANDRIDHRGVRRLTVARNEDGDPRLCLDLGQGRAALLDSGLAVTAQTAACRDDLGSDGLWRYEQEAGGLHIHALDRRQRSGQRTLKGGRFTDEIAIGLPVPQRTSDGRIEHLVPTVAGVVAFETDAAPKGLYLPAFPDLPRASTPAVLVAEADGRIAYLGKGSLVTLADETQRPLPLPRLLPDSAKPVALETGPGGTLRLGWEAAGTAGWTLFDPRDPTGSLVSTEPINTASWREYAELRAAVGNAEPSLQVGIAGPALRLSSGFGSATPLPLPAVGLQRAVIRADRRMFVVGSGDVLDIDLAGALRATAPGARAGH
ncbi:hypothetical protein [Azospirillum brasilense]|uniref:hypothetical protein n=1 Tax=Azospirillum brasilense TaxID=192 RepID=UPI0013B3834B|nr:hypothetical protein [Azospirillum brasilense]